MRILHTSDWHLGITLNNVSLLEEQEQFLEQLCRISREERIDAVILAGDVFDHAVSNADAISLYNEAMTELCMKQNKLVLVCAGNHDGAARLASCSALLERAGLFIAGSIRDGLKRVETEDTVFHLLPYFSIDEARFLYPERELRDYDTAMRAVIGGMKLCADKHNILAAHCFVAGASPTESDRSAMVGGANLVGADAFAGFDYVALGHLHRAQNAGDHVCYSGSPIKFSFAEANHQKSVTVIDTQDFSYTEIPISTEKDLRVISGNYDEVLRQAQNDDRRDDYIKIELKDEFAHIELLNLFRGFYPNLLSMTGKQLKDAETVLSVEQAENLNPEEIMKMFFREHTGEEPSERQIEWFRRALAVQERGGDAQ